MDCDEGTKNRFGGRVVGSQQRLSVGCAHTRDVFSETTEAYGAAMTHNDLDDNPTEPETVTHRAAHPFGHLIPRSGTGPSHEDSQRERAQRAGSRKKDWWKKYLPPEEPTP